MIAFVFIMTQSKMQTFYWQKNARLIYDYSSRDFIQGSFPNSGSLFKNISMRAKLNVRVFSITDAEVVLGIQFSPVSIKVMRIQNKDAEKLYSLPFFVSIDKQGRFKNFYFNNTIAETDEKNIMNTLRNMEFKLKKTAFTSWKTTETNQIGQYSAIYKKGKNKISKRIASYQKIYNEDGTIDTKSEIKIARAKRQMQYGKPTIWFKNFKMNELLSFRDRNKKPYLKLSSSMKVKQLPFDEYKSDILLWKMKSDFKQYISIYPQKPKNHISIAKKNAILNLKLQYGNMTLQSLARKLLKKHKTFSSPAVTQMVKYLLAYPEKSKNLIPLLYNKSYNKLQKAMLIHVLMKTGHSAAQSALIEIGNSYDLHKDIQLQAVMAFGNITSCTEQGIEFLKKKYYTRNNSDLDSYLGNTAILSLGTVAKIFDNKINDDDRQMAQSIKHMIKTDIAANNDLGTTTALIHAAGNTADKEFIKPIGEYLGSDNPRIRSTAAMALIHIEDPQVDDMLRDKISSENNPNVRGALIDSLRKIKASDDTIVEITKAIKNETNEIVRGHMYQFLLKNRNAAGVKDALSDMLITESTMKYRKIIHRALSTKK